MALLSDAAPHVNPVGDGSRAVGRGGVLAPARSMFFLFSNRLGCAGSILFSLLGTLLLIAMLRGCSSTGW